MRVLRTTEARPQLPVGTVTFVLADLEGSVRLWEADRAAMTMAVRRLDTLLDAAVARHHGVRPVEQGEGDSFVIAFARPTDAVSCAVSLQRAVAEEPWPGGLTLRVRMAIHTGEAQLRDEANYVGNAINRAGRLRSLAHGGQVLVSATTFELVADNLPEQVAARDLGLQRIRDLARPVRIFQITHPDLDDAFPPLRSVEALTQHLPTALTAFVGRDVELRDVTQHLAENRVLTLTGAGGCGKTRLALEVARRAIEHFPDGAWFADLSLVRDGGNVATAVLAAVGRKPSQDVDPTEALIAHLASRRALLILDNCEHLVGACADLVRDLAGHCPALTILATSREPLRVEGEMAWRVPSMSTPRAGSVDSLATYDAVRLFIDRARHARPNFAVTNDNAPAVAAICHQLDGIPLALELAAARVRMMTAEQIAAGLWDRFRLLGGSARAALPRQQTLAASVEWSHDLLSERERRLLYRLSVFSGGFTLDAAERVGAGDDIDVYDVLDLLSSLVDKSLVLVEEHGDRVRYRLLETIRQFSRNKLAAEGEEGAAREAHAWWYAGFVAEANQHLTGADQARWFARLDEELDNIRAALEWATDNRQTQLTNNMVLLLCWFWNVRGHWHEAARWIDRALANDGDAPENSWLLEFFGAAMRGMISEPARGVPGAQAAVDGFRRDGNEWGMAWAFNILGKYTSPADIHGALAYFDQAAAHARACGNTSVLVDTLAFAAWNELLLGRTGAAEERLSEARRAATQAGDARGQLVTLNVLAAVLIRRANHGGAAAVLEESLELAHVVGDRLSHAVALLSAGHLEMSRGHLTQAKELFDEGLEVGKETGSSFAAAADAFVTAGALLAGDPAGAVVLGRPSRESPGEPGIGTWLHFLSPRPAAVAEALVAIGDLEAAEASIDRLLAAARSSGHVVGEAHALRARSALHRSRGSIAAAEDDGHAALAVFYAADAVADTLTTLEMLAGYAAGSESYVEAARVLGATEALRASYGCVRPPFEQPNFDATVARLRAAVDPDALAESLAAGAEMSLADACSYATRGRGERKRPSTGWDSLTPTEVDVVRLVATGATNREVAERLFISPNTVKTHLAHVFAKVGVTTRAELAMQATTRRL